MPDSADELPTLVIGPVADATKARIEQPESSSQNRSDKDAARKFTELPPPVPQQVSPNSEKPANAADSESARAAGFFESKRRQLSEIIIYDYSLWQYLKVFAIGLAVLVFLAVTFPLSRFVNRYMNPPKPYYTVAKTWRGGKRLQVHDASGELLNAVVFSKKGEIRIDNGKDGRLQGEFVKTRKPSKVPGELGELEVFAHGIDGKPAAIVYMYPEIEVEFTQDGGPIKFHSVTLAKQELSRQRVDK